MSKDEPFTKADMRKDLGRMTGVYLERLKYISENVAGCGEELSNARGLVENAHNLAIKGLEK